MSHRLELEPLRRAHATDLFEGLADPELYRFLDELPPASEAALAARFARWEQGSPYPHEQWKNWAVKLKDGRYIGYVQATIRVRVREALIAYVLFRPAWGQGFATEAVTLMLGQLRALDVTTLRATVDARNARSVALLTRLGMTCVAEDGAEQTFAGRL